MENTDMKLSQRAWDSAKTYNSSDFVSRHNAAIDQDSIETFSNFLKKRPLETAGIDMDTKESDELLKYTIKRVVPSRKLDELDNPAEMFLISDQYGHDIGTYCIGEEGLPVFKLADKIEKGNNKIIDKLYPNIESEARAILKQEYDVPNLETLTNKLAKGENLTITSEDRAKEDVAKAYEERGLTVERPEKTEEEKKELEEEEQAIESLPADVRAEVLELCRNENIRIKEVLVVDCPECVGRELEGTNSSINPKGGPIVMVKAINRTVSTHDDLYVFQSGQKVKGYEEKQDRLMELMDQHKGEGAVAELEDTREDEIMKQLEEAVLEYEKQVEEIENTEYPTSTAKFEAMAEAKGNLKENAIRIMGDYVPDSDGQVSNYVKAIEYEATPDKMEEIDAMENDIRDGIIKGAKSAGALAKYAAIGAVTVGAVSLSSRDRTAKVSDENIENEDIEKENQSQNDSKDTKKQDDGYERSIYEHDMYNPNRPY